jgi:hypothetical protein
MELGLFLGAQHYGGGAHSKKISLVLDKDPYRHQKFISDLAGQDIKSHGARLKDLFAKVSEFLRTTQPHLNIPGGQQLHKDWSAFRKVLSSLCKDVDLNLKELTFDNMVQLLAGWLKSKSSKLGATASKHLRRRA